MFDLLHIGYASFNEDPQVLKRFQQMDSKGFFELCENIRVFIRLKRNIRIDYSFFYKYDPNNQMHYSVWYKGI